ncbi:MAG: hypothetical protein GQ525_09500 [Draconibacterium sp.]|nr:hypothetical protein [Draconibacterium sp.]
MKDITISGKRIKKELIIFAVSLAAAFVLNIYAISKFNTDWNEIVNQLHIVFLIGGIIYFLVLVFRLIFFGISSLTKKSKK